MNVPHVLVCRCGHPVLAHALVRDPVDRQYAWRSCAGSDGRCGCERFVDERDPPEPKPARPPAPLSAAARADTLRLSVRWRYEQVAWGMTECHRRRCSNAAELLYDGLPLCVDCADDLLERVHVLAVNPELAATMPAWDE